MNESLVALGGHGLAVRGHGQEGGEHPTTHHSTTHHHAMEERLATGHGAEAALAKLLAHADQFAASDKLHLNDLLLKRAQLSSCLIPAQLPDADKAIASGVGNG